MSARTNASKSRPTPATLGLYVREEHDNTFGGGYYHVKAHPVWVGRTPEEYRDIDAGRQVDDVSRTQVRNASTRYELHQGLYLDGLMVNSQGCSRDTTRHLYGFEIEYRDVFSVDARTAERMHKTLSTIERKMSKLADQWGRPATFGQYLLRVAAALGATRIVLPRKDARDGSYADMDLRIEDLRTGASCVDYRVEQWIAAGQPATVAS